MNSRMMRAGPVQERFAIIETSSMAGQVALAQGETLLGVRRLEEARRHARDLVPALRDLLAEQGWKARDLSGIIVSRGPGSYSGLRVGIMTAKALAYATGCALLGVDTFTAIALQAPLDAGRAIVLADAQQNKAYVQTFVRSESGRPMRPDSALAIRALPEILEQVTDRDWLTGPCVRDGEALWTGHNLVDAHDRQPRVESLLQLGLEKFRSGTTDDVLKMEPLYLRPSSAEEKWQAGSGKEK
jgi:tRNA threonylcarbamoyladenosine biosynthesis protein TsaB